MPQFEEQYVGNHRRQQSLVLAVSLIGLLLAIAPRQERALFITQANGLTAFGAAFPPITIASLIPGPGGFNSGDTPSAFFAGVPGRPAGTSPFGEAPAGTPGGGGSGGESPVGNGGPAAPLGDAPAFQPAAGPGGSGGGGGGLPFSPASASPPASSPVVPAAVGTPTPADTPTPAPTASSTPTTPGDNPTTPVVTPTTTPTPVPAVPEPATWLMLLAGFVGIGLVLRRRAALLACEESTARV